MMYNLKLFFLCIIYKHLQIVLLYLKIIIFNVYYLKKSWNIFSWRKESTYHLITSCQFKLGN